MAHLFRHTTPILLLAEQNAKQFGNTNSALDALRALSLEDFAVFIMSMPLGLYPSLSALLPKMASAETQKAWTGVAGDVLIEQTTAFVRQLQGIYAKYLNRGLQDATIMDFGCGYGRVMRLLYYFSNPENIWGVDAWQKSLALAKESRVLGHLVQSERVPTTLPVGATKFNLAFALSIFTHLAPKSAEACLSAVRGHMQDGGLFVLTVRPVEFWSMPGRPWVESRKEEMIKQHEATGYAYLPHNGQEGDTYGDSSIEMSYFSRPGWKFLGYERSLNDPYQTSVVLQAA